MKLTKSTDFALRLLVHLSMEEKHHRTPALADLLDIPYNHLTKLVQALTKSGFVQTKQGKYGGVLLRKKPKDISLKDVVYVTEGPTQLVECVNDKNACTLFHACQLKTGIIDVQNRLDALFESISLFDLMDKKDTCNCHIVEEKIGEMR